MTKAPINLQDLRRRIYTKAKADKTWRFWGLYVHVCKDETLLQAFKLAKANNGAPGIDGISFEDIERDGVGGLIREIRKELVGQTYQSARYRKKDIPKEGGKVRTLSIPTIKDRVVQGALKLILEPIFEADFYPGSFGYRPKRTAHQAVETAAGAIIYGKTKVIDVDIARYFDNVRHDILLAKIAKRVNDEKIMHLIKLILKAGGRRGVGQGGIISPLFANIYLNELDGALEKLKAKTTYAQKTKIEYVRYADDLVILIYAGPYAAGLDEVAKARIDEELAKLDLKLNQDKTRMVDLAKGESFSFLGFDYRRFKTRTGKWGCLKTPRLKARTSLLAKLKDIFARFVSQPVSRVVYIINPILRGWANYFRIGNSTRCFNYIRRWVERKVRRHLMRAKARRGFGWKRWSKEWLYQTLGLYADYKIRYYQFPKASSN